ncbi:MAG: acetyltransferase [Rhodospirillales bacterium]|nr:acetyltransferase [Rhodospirillales bacterium]
MQDIIIIGASDTFDLVWASYAKDKSRIIGYLGLSQSQHSVFPDYPYLGESVSQACADHPDAAFVVSVYNNQTRRRLSEEVQAAGAVLLSPRHPDCTIYPTAMLEEGVLVAPQAVISTRANVGQGVYVNYGALVGHDVRVGDFSFISPGTRVLGEASIGSGVLLGTNVVVLAKVSIGDNAEIGANMVVAKDIPANATVLPQQKTRTLGV